MSTSGFLARSQAAPRRWREPCCAHRQSRERRFPPLLKPPAAKNQTASPIKHVIVIIGENRSFDHVFATYQPKNGQTVSNLLSKGIVKADGSQGPNYSLSAQYSAVDSTTYAISPGGKTLYTNIPPVVAGGPTTPYFAIASTGSRDRTRPACRVRLLRSDHWRDWTLRLHCARHAHPQCLGSARRHVPIDSRQFPTVPTPTVPCTASIRCGNNGLQHGLHHHQQPQRLPERPVPLGRSHHRRRQRWFQRLHHSSRPATSPPGKVPPPWNSSTCSMAMLPI